MKKAKISVLRRSNGFYGVYVNGSKPEHLVSNGTLKNSVEMLFNTIELASRGYEKVEVEFTSDEGRFKSGLPSLQDYMRGGR